MKTLPRDITRCHGWQCELKETCLRYLTLSEDDKYDVEFGYRLKSYVNTLMDKDGICKSLIKDA